MHISKRVVQFNSVCTCMGKLIYIFVFLWFSGIDLLKRRIEEEVLRFTGRMHIRMRVASGSDSAAWLYKELTVTNTEPDPECPQYLFVDVIATAVQVHKFKRFLREWNLYYYSYSLSIKFVLL